MEKINGYGRAPCVRIVVASIDFEMQSIRGRQVREQCRVIARNSKNKPYRTEKLFGK